MKKLLLFLCCFALSVVLASELYAQATNESAGGMANPAAVYCTELGYEYKAEGQEGFCVFNGSEQCEEWSFLKGTCGQKYSFCAQNGYDIITETDGRNPLSSEYAVCVQKPKAARATGRAAAPARDKVGSVTELMGLDSLAAGSPQKTGGAAASAPSRAAAQLLPELPAAASASSSLSWRALSGQDWLSPVKNQGASGTCIAFAIAGQIEARYNIAANNPWLDIDLSEENLVKCESTAYPSYYTRMQLEGIVDEACYPYTDTGSGSTCTGRCSDWASRLYYITGSTLYSSPSLASLQELIAENGPVYSGMSLAGYFDENHIYRCTGSIAGINHAVVIAGYVDTGNVNTGYWVVKNSWGASWEDSGYFKVGFGECHIAESVTDIAVSQPVKVKWQYGLGSSTVSSSPAVGTDGTIYIGSDDTYLYALNATGTLKWKYATAGAVSSSPAVAADGTIYVGSGDNYIYAVTSAGALKWKYATGGVVSSSPAVAADGTIYVGSSDNYIYAITSAGALKWRYATAGAVSSSPAVAADGTIYVGSGDDYIYALNPAGTLKWRYATAGAVNSSPAIAADGTVYAGSNDAYLYALTPAGALKWRFAATGAVSSSPAIAADGTVYVGAMSPDNRLYALNPADGTKKWEFVTGAGIFTSPAVDRDGVIFIGSFDGSFSAVSPVDGAKLWSVGSAGAFYFSSSPVIAANGTVYVGYTNNLYAIANAGNGPARSAWPLFRAAGTHNGRTDDTDADGIVDRIDNCPSVANADQADLDGDGTGNVCDSDLDGDAVVNTSDNCPANANADQKDTDGDGIGDACDSDLDADGIANTSDNCPLIANPGQQDSDADGFGDACDNCPSVASPTQDDFDGDGIGNACDSDGGVKWSYELGAMAVLSSPALALDGTVYIGSGEGMLYALRADGSLKWSYAAGGAINQAPAVAADGTVYAAAGDAKLYAVNPADGSLKWVFPASGAIGAISSSPAIASDGTVYIGSEDAYLYAVKPDGSFKWYFHAGGAIHTSPAVAADGTIYIGADNGKLYAINPDNSKKWEFPASTTVGSITASPAIASDGTIYAASTDGRLYAVNPVDGSQKWVFPSATLQVGKIIASPAIGASGSIYIVADDSYLYGVNPDGTWSSWYYQTGGHYHASLAVGANGTIYAGSDNGRVYAINSDKSTRWVFGYGSSITVASSPAIAADGTIYVGYRSRLYAITSPSAGPALSSWPLFRGSNSRTGRVRGAGDPCSANSDCNDGLFCNGVETCSAQGVCAAGTNPCLATQVCNEGADTCSAADADGDGYTVAQGDCNDASAAVHPGAAERCNGIDDDCDGQTDEGFTLGAACSVGLGECSRTGQTVCLADGTGTACSATAGAPAAETCNAKDDDCDGQTDEGVKLTYYRDADSDTYGTSATTSQACAAPAGYVANSLDCNDASAAIKPGATEVCGDSVDNNCDGSMVTGCSELKGNWKLNETTGTTASDSSGNNVSGTLTNGPVWTESALKFDGQNDYVTLGTNAFGISSEFTVSCWFKTTANISKTQVLVQRDGSTYPFRLTIESSKLKGYYRTGLLTTNNIASATTLAANTWYQAVLTFKSGAQVLYLNGASTGSKTTSGSPYIGSSKTATIGQTAASSPYPVTIVDDVRIYNKSLSATEVSQLYASGRK